MFVNSKIIRNRKLLEKDGIHNIAWFSSIMSVIQYKQQLWYFHLCHNTVPKKHSCNLYELGGLLQSLSKKSQQMYTPTQGLSVDESNAWHSMQSENYYIYAKKPPKFGITIWSLCKTWSEYCLQFKTLPGKTDSAQEKGLAYWVVTDFFTYYISR